RDFHVTGVQTCALPIWPSARGDKKSDGPPPAGQSEAHGAAVPLPAGLRKSALDRIFAAFLRTDQLAVYYSDLHRSIFMTIYLCEIGRASCRERGQRPGV